ncbi:Dabb family protein [Paenibacillus montanisoli]|uniref:Dabb family protein n=1 Tax=Paenibacillus montanisoli TaxID=2081970 RepID=A0A328TWG2_9BACL|nr:Dabb family protein [Paenibacillus montanisoli]RAP74002.1 Dabb family protein [Paenibacillus montanisoli]
MIEHVVIIKFKENTSSEHLHEVCSRFKLLKGRIPGLVDVRAGINFTDKNQGYQILLTAQFENRAALESYGPHPDHRAVADFIREAGRIDSIVLDIEI